MMFPNDYITIITTNMIELKDLTYGYLSFKPILKGLNLKLEEGHVYGLLGKNGVGKSTLLKVLTGALIGKGDYTIDGMDPRKRLPELQQRYRLVPENEALYNVTIDDLMKVTRPFYPTFDTKLFDSALKEFDVPRAQRLPQMSLGQQKKALISLSLACGTPYLFMDEPTNGMDIPSKAIFRRIMADAVASQIDDNGHCHQTVIISTHQVDDLENLIDAVIILENDGVLLSTTLEHLEDLRASGMDIPVDMKELFIDVVTNPDKYKTL